MNPLEIINKIKQLHESLLALDEYKDALSIIKNNILYLDHIIYFYSQSESINSNIIDNVLKNTKWTTDPVALYLLDIDDINDKSNKEVIENLINFQLLLSWLNILFIKYLAKEIEVNHNNISESIRTCNEIKNKLVEVQNQLSNSQASINEINNFKSTIKALNDEASTQSSQMKTHIDTITNYNSIAKQASDEAIAHNVKSKTIVDGLSEKEKEYNKILAVIENCKKEIEDINKKSINQQEQIDNTIELANRHGMAGSFKRRKDELSKMQILWISLFVGSIIVMFVFSLCNLLPLVREGKYFELLSRLPFIGPIFWLAWYSIVQFGYTTKLIEDYSFKYATALAFEGYKNQIKEDDKEKKFTSDLIKVTIDNFSKHPIRIYSKKVETTPFNEIIDKLNSLTETQINELVAVLQKLIDTKK